MDPRHHALPTLVRGRVRVWTTIGRRASAAPIIASMIRPATLVVSTAAVLLLAACTTQPDADDDLGGAPDAGEQPAVDEPDQADEGPDGAPDDEVDGDQGDAEGPDGGPEEPGPEPAPLDEVAITLTRVADGDQPTDAAVAPDGTLYVAERAGFVRPLSGDRLGEAVLDISADTSTDSERGLLGIAFDDGRLFVSYTDNGGDSRVDVFDWGDGTVDTASRRGLLSVAQPRANHNGGDIAIGPDRLLWVGLGDGGGAGDPFETGQDLTTPLGALLRLDPSTGEAAAGNPFTGAEADPRIWAYGLRNPWRFSFDMESGDLWIGDVGQNAQEEVNHVPAGEGAGANFGWNLMEGTSSFAGSAPDDHWAPIHTYPTNQAGCAVTGGYVYRGSEIDGLQGAYVYSDFCEGGVRALRHDGQEVTEHQTLPTDGTGRVVSFAQDADGELYVLTFGNGILRIDPR